MAQKNNNRVTIMKQSKELTITHTALQHTKHCAKRLFAAGITCFLGMLLTQTTKAWSSESNDSNEQLLRQFVQSKGPNIIVFDSSNIKQFWIDNTVISKGDSFDVLLNENDRQESVPLKIQLANVSVAEDCKIEVIANKGDFSFSVLNSSSKVISTSYPEDDFLRFKAISSTVHLTDTGALSFYLRFSSKTNQEISIKKIVLSFSDNSSFLVTPGVLKITEKDVNVDATEIKHVDINSFSVSGKMLDISSIKKILVSDNPISNSVTIKNIGKTTTRVYFGYAPYTVRGQNIHNRNNPYNNKNQILNIIEAKANSSKIIVDSYPDWEKGCFLVINAKEDLSDFPNFNFIGSITDVKKIDETHTEIVLGQPLNSGINRGEKVRIQSKYGYKYLFTNVKQLEPGEEATFSSAITKNEDFLQYSPQAFCRGTYYVVPVIFSNSDDSNETVSILIRNFSVSY